MPKLTDTQKQNTFEFFQHVQNRLCAAFEQVDGTAMMQRTPWTKEGMAGEMAVIRGPVVEKAGANVSRVTGPEYPVLDKESQNLKGPFFASGVSTITHMFNPYAPIAHMNVRILEVGDDFWVGGGGDLTPCFPFEEDTNEFHSFMKQACENYERGSYEKYAKWADEYFLIKHRKSTRGVGGVFFDYVKGEYQKVFDFIQSVALAYVEIYPKILNRRKNTAFTPDEKDKQLYWRGRYVEFNLVYDRGTKFGLETGGNVDAILVSLPPVVKW